MPKTLQNACSMLIGCFENRKLQILPFNGNWLFIYRCICDCLLYDIQGLVEKWLKEVQTIMLDSMLTQMKAAYDSCWTSNHGDWILKWCGQIVQTILCTVWTKEVKMRFTAGKLGFWGGNVLFFFALGKLNSQGLPNREQHITPIIRI